MITRRCSTCRASAPCRSPQGLLVVDNLINSVASLTCTQLFCPGRTIAALLPTEFSDASGSVLYKRFACRPRLIRDLQTILKHPWSEAVILQGEPTIGKADQVSVSQGHPARKMHCTQQNTACLTFGVVVQMGCCIVTKGLHLCTMYHSINSAEHTERDNKTS